jgi:hypothetical protein
MQRREDVELRQLTSRRAPRRLISLKRGHKISHSSRLVHDRRPLHAIARRVTRLHRKIVVGIVSALRRALTASLRSRPLAFMQRPARRSRPCWRREAEVSPPPTSSNIPDRHIPFPLTFAPALRLLPAFKSTTTREPTLAARAWDGRRGPSVAEAGHEDRFIACAVLLVAGSGFAIMNNACKSGGYHAWCAPASSIRHHAKIG